MHHRFSPPLVAVNDDDVCLLQMLQSRLFAGGIRVEM